VDNGRFPLFYSATSFKIELKHFIDMIDAVNGKVWIDNPPNVGEQSEHVIFTCHFVSNCLVNDAVYGKDFVHDIFLGGLVRFNYSDLKRYASQRTSPPHNSYTNPNDG
jgi:hypothetical protein